MTEVAKHSNVQYSTVLYIHMSRQSVTVAADVCLLSYTHSDWGWTGWGGWLCAYWPEVGSKLLPPVML